MNLREKHCLFQSGIIFHGFESFRVLAVWGWRSSALQRVKECGGMRLGKRLWKVLSTTITATIIVYSIMAITGPHNCPFGHLTISLSVCWLVGSFWPGLSCSFGTCLRPDNIRCCLKWTYCPATTRIGLLLASRHLLLSRCLAIQAQKMANVYVFGHKWILHSARTTTIRQRKTNRLPLPEQQRKTIERNREKDNGNHKVPFDESGLSFGILRRNILPLNFIILKLVLEFLAANFYNFHVIMRKGKYCQENWDKEKELKIIIQINEQWSEVAPKWSFLQIEENIFRTPIHNEFIAWNREQWKGLNVSRERIL